MVIAELYNTLKPGPGWTDRLFRLKRRQQRLLLNAFVNFSTANVYKKSKKKTLFKSTLHLFTM